MSSGDLLLGPARPARSAMVVKRVFDIVVSVVCLVVLLPLFIVVAIFIKLNSPGTVFFRQERVGWRGRPFRIFKFRSMVVGASSAGTALTVRADRRVTTVGAFLRRSKIDELPQLINVLFGEMSIVGPRPEVPEFMRFYTAAQHELIVSMRPGLTDYAAICFHDESSMLDGDDDPIEIYRHRIMPIKFALYERYSNDIGVLTDLKIILATFFLLITGRVPNVRGIGHEFHRIALSATKELSLHHEQRVPLSVDVPEANRADRLGITR